MNASVHSVPNLNDWVLEYARVHSVPNLNYCVLECAGVRSGQNYRLPYALHHSILVKANIFVNRCGAYAMQAEVFKAIAHASAL